MGIEDGEAIDLNNLAELPDNLDDLDLSKLPRGNDLPAPAAPAAAPAAAADTVPAGAGADTAAGAAGEDTAAGAAGEDTAAGAAGEDTAAGAAGTDQARDPETGRFIPKARFDQVIERSREREERDAQRIRSLEEALRKAAPPADAPDVGKLKTQLDELAEKQIQAIQDGRTEEAVKATREMASISRQIAETEAAARAGMARAEAVEEVRLDMAITQLEEAYPQLRQDHEKFDRELSEEIFIRAQEMNVARGIPMSQALLRAASEIVQKREFAVLKEENERLKAAQAGGDKTKAGVKAAPQPSRVEKNTAAAQATPPNAAAVGVDTDKAGGSAPLNVDVTALTEDEYAALPEATKARLRGDFRIPA